MRVHRTEEVEPGHDVVAEVLERLAHGNADERVGGEVHDGVGGEALDGGIDGGGVAQVAADEMRTGLDGGLVPLLEIVEDEDRVAAPKEDLRGDAANVAGAAGDEDFHAGNEFRG